jgi:cell division protein FtsQ
VTGPPKAPPAPTHWQPPIDPRIRQRRIEVRRSEGRRRLRVILILLGLALLALAGWGATRSPLLDVDHIRLSGTQHTSFAQVIGASRIHRGMAMVDVGEGGAASRIRALPWVRRATVRREWPATVSIVVEERSPVAAAPAAGGVALVDLQGRVLELMPAAPADQPLLLGLPPAGRPGSRLGGRAADLLAVARALPPLVVPRVAGVAAGAGDQVELRLRPTGVVRLGSPDQLGEKLLAIQTVLAQVDLSRLAVLDVRVPASPALTRTP